MSVAVRTTLIQRIEQIRAVVAADYRESKHHHGQGRRPAFIAGCLDFLTRLVGKLHRNAAVAIFPLDPHAMHRMWPDLPEHLMRRAIVVFQTLGLITRVSKLARRTSRSKSPTPGATAAWYAPSQYRFTDRVLALLGLPTSSLENLTDEEEPSNVKELEEGGFSNSFKTMSSGVLAGYGLTEAELACLSETERRTLASYAEEEAQGIAEDREKGWTMWATSTAARILADLRYKARTWAAEGAEFRRGVQDLKRLAAGYEPPKPTYRTISKAQVTHQSFRPANVGKIPAHMTAEDLAYDQAKRIMDGRLDPLTVWGLIPGMGEDEARAIHKRDARMTYEDIIRRRLKRADVNDPDYHQAVGRALRETTRRP